MKRCMALILTILLTVVALPASAGDYDDMMNKAYAFIESREYDKALAAFTLLQRVQPGDSVGYVGEAWVRIQLADYAGAARAIDQALDIAPLNGDNWLWSALIDAKRGDVAAFEENMLFAEVCGAYMTDGAGAGQ